MTHVQWYNNNGKYFIELFKGSTYIHINMGKEQSSENRKYSVSVADSIYSVNSYWTPLWSRFSFQQWGQNDK